MHALAHPSSLLFATQVQDMYAKLFASFLCINGTTPIV